MSPRGRPKGPTPLTASRIAELPDLLSQGIGFPQIGTRWGVSKSYVWGLAKQLGLTAEDYRTPRNLMRIQARHAREVSCFLCLDPTNRQPTSLRVFCPACSKLQIDDPSLRQALAQPAAGIVLAWLENKTETGLCLVCMSPVRRGRIGRVTLCTTCGKPKAIAVRVRTAIAAMKRYPQFDWRRVLWAVVRGALHGPRTIAPNTYIEGKARRNRRKEAKLPQISKLFLKQGPLLRIAN